MSDHRIEYVESSTLWRWRCACGANTSGRWYSSAEEAAKAGTRHLEENDIFIPWGMPGNGGLDPEEERY